MKKILIAAAAISAAMATPALANNANFVGPRAEITAGVDDVTKARDTSDISYGAAIGIDAPLFGDKLTIGAEVSTDNAFQRDRTFGASVRLGAAVTDNVLVYGIAGYQNYRNISFANRASTLDGLSVGGGLEVKLTGPLYAGAEYRYTDFDGHVGRHAAKVKVGVRF